MRKLYLIFLFSSIIIGQSKLGALSGYVYDYDSGEPVWGANIILQDLNIGIATNSSGYYEIASIPFGQHQIKVSFLAYITIYDSIKISSDNYQILKDYKIQYTIEDYKIIENSEIKKYHNNLIRSAKEKEIIEFSIDSLSYSNSELYFYSTFKNNTAYPVYILSEKECIKPFTFIITNSECEEIERNMISLSCDEGKFYNPDSSDLIRIPPYGVMKYKKTEIWLYNFESLPKDIYNISILYEFQNPMEIRKFRNQNIDKYLSEIFAATMGLRGKYYSSNTIRYKN
jgi:hypothetical protein